MRDYQNMKALIFDFNLLALLIMSNPICRKGNDNIHLISTSGPHKLSIYLEDFDEKFVYANYSLFMLGEEYTNYVLSISNYTGSSHSGDSLSFHNNHPFSTKDKNNDKAGTIDCAVVNHGAWWYDQCSHSNLNGPYLAGQQHNETSIQWHSWKAFYSLKKTTMMITRI